MQMLVYYMLSQWALILIIIFFLFSVLVSTILSFSPFMCSYGLSNLLFLLSNVIFT